MTESKTALLSPLSKGLDEEFMNTEVGKSIEAQLSSMVPYGLLEEIPSVNETNAPSLLARLSKALIQVSDLHGALKSRSKKAYKSRKEAESRAFLEKFNTYVEEQKEAGNTVKNTDTAKGHYVNIDLDVKSAADVEAFYEAAADHIGTVKTALIMDISAVKSIAYGYKESSSVSSYDVPE